MKLCPLLSAGALATLLPMTAAIPARAEPVLHEARLGVLAHDVDYLWSNVSREDGVDLNAEVSFDRSLRLWRGDIRPAIGLSVNTAGDTSKAYVDARWEFDPTDRIFAAIGIGAAIHDGDLEPESADRKALGSRVLLHFPAEIGWRLNYSHSISIYFDHVSNAWLADPNEGMDTLGVRYGYRF